ncbi:GntR family transcriptional regulator [Microlunatus sp. Gsoil 973]|uniref:GntR family transcriptional regulator n=1 Tax=Microlunatus sp. Gsoil 973 TaxID=2672569 RepID=UPI001E3CAA30|nr:GntR family transcriptional regulator [Microlunatus sp. Gsoil 973]
MIEGDRPIFLQIAEMIENDIVEGHLAADEQVPSTNEFAAHHRINPATAAKGINRLVDDGILYKKRGIGMFVAATARDALLAKRKARFVENYLEPMLAEARKLGISPGEVTALITRGDGAIAGRPGGRVES